ncbi:MAG: hypothetical protein QM757_46835 [Paludibaculum sp.]
MSTGTTPSDRRLAANRANARKSTGPRTAAGKRISSQNARKTPPCPFTFELPAQFASEWFHDALRRTAACTDVRARLLLINRCMLQAHEIRWSALERTLFDVAFQESAGCIEDAALWLAQQLSAAKGLTAYHRWITHRINQVERSLAALAGQSAGVEAEAPKAMAAGAGAASAFSELTSSDLGPDSILPVTFNDSGWNFGALSGLFTYRVGAPQPPRPPQPPKPPTIGPIRGRYRLYLKCPAAPKRENEATTASASILGDEGTRIERTHQSSEPAVTSRPAPSQSICRTKSPSAQPANLPQQTALPPSSPTGPNSPTRSPQHSHRHCRWPVPTTTEPETNPIPSEPNLRREDNPTLSPNDPISLPSIPTGPNNPTTSPSMPTGIAGGPFQQQRRPKQTQFPPNPTSKGRTTPTLSPNDPTTSPSIPTGIAGGPSQQQRSPKQTQRPPSPISEGRTTPTLISNDPTRSPSIPTGIAGGPSQQQRSPKQTQPPPSPISEGWTTPTLSPNDPPTSPSIPTGIAGGTSQQQRRPSQPNKTPSELPHRLTATSSLAQPAPPPTPQIEPKPSLPPRKEATAHLCHPTDPFAT